MFVVKTGILALGLDRTVSLSPKENAINRVSHITHVWAEDS